MGSIKDDLLKRIEKRAQRHNDLRKEIEERSENAEAFILKMVKDLDETVAKTANIVFDTDDFINYYIASVENQIQTLDFGAQVEISWQAQPEKGKMPRINGILVKWSPEYQKEHDCEPELYVDVFQLLFTV